MKHASVPQLLEWLGVTAFRWELLERYAGWLATEGAKGGVLGPAEPERLWERHLADALSFAAGFEEPPAELFDLGSGGGLPGIPLAILFPETEVRLVERSGRRAALLRRVIRLLDLPNATVEQRDVASIAGAAAVTMRAVFPPERAAPTVQRILGPGGRGVIGLARRHDASSGWYDLGGAILQVPVLDPPGWLLIMQGRGEKTTSGDGSGHQPEGRGR